MEEKSPSQLKNQALNALDGKWTTAAIAGFIYIALLGILGYYQTNSIFFYYPNTLLSMGLISIFIIPVLDYGFMTMFVNLSENNNFRVEDIFSGFSKYFRILIPMLLSMIYIFLWSLLLIIPGIIKSYSYSQLPYIIQENPHMDANQAIDLSRDMMSGNKARLFYQDLTFIGWHILSIITMGIGYIWVLPYWATTRAEFYSTIKQEQKDTLDI